MNLISVSKKISPNAQKHDSPGRHPTYTSVCTTKHVILESKQRYSGNQSMNVGHPSWCAGRRARSLTLFNLRPRCGAPFSSKFREGPPPQPGFAALRGVFLSTFNQDARIPDNYSSIRDIKGEMDCCFDTLFSAPHECREALPENQRERHLCAL